MRKISLIFILPLLVILLTACNKVPIDTNMSEKVAPFSYINQDAEQMTLEDLEDSWWIADFIFTNCETVCLPMTSNMAELQTELEANGLDVQLISFSVDPTYDTPEVLTEYGMDYEANFDSWNFLTGYEFQEIKELSIKSFRAPLKEPTHGSDQVLHDTRFFLVNPKGKVIKGYDGVQAKSIDEIITDIMTLQKNNLL